MDVITDLSRLEVKLMSKYTSTPVEVDIARSSLKVRVVTDRLVEFEFALIDGKLVLTERTYDGENDTPVRRVLIDWINEERQPAPMFHPIMTAKEYEDSFESPESGDGRRRE